LTRGSFTDKEDIVVVGKDTAGISCRRAFLFALLVAFCVTGFAFSLFLFAGPASAQSIVYVDKDATGANDGSSWADAYTDLQPALRAAQANTEIWVAEGTYKPTTGTTDRRATFLMKSGVALYGGFAGNETQRSARNPSRAANNTTLSGDLAGNDRGNPADFANHVENSYHVLVASGTDATAVLDGFTVRGGNADAGGSDFGNNNGGGMYNDAGSPTIRNVTFTSNRSGLFVAGGAGSGGAMYNSNGGRPTITNATFSSNLSTGSGGGIYNASGSSPTVTNALFSGNTANNGGGIADVFSNSTVVNSVFTGANTSSGGGVAVVRQSSAEGSPPTSVINSTFSGNGATGGGFAALNNNGDLVIRNSILWGGGTNQIFNTFSLGGYTSVEHSIVQGGYSGDGNSNRDPKFANDLRLQPNSPAVNAGDNDFLPADTQDLDGDSNTTEKVPYDLAGNARIYQNTDPALQIVDMGAYELQREPENASPAVNDPIPDQTLEAGGAAFTTNLADVFSDADGDPLSFTANSSDTGVATASVSGSTLTVTPLKAGTATITVTANDGRGGSGQDTFDVTVTTTSCITDPLVVNTTSDGSPDANDCETTLREAIAHANGKANGSGPDTISFAIPEDDPGRNQQTGVFTIAPTSALPAISDPVVIDGYTQDGASPNTLERGSNARLLIELSGQNAGSATGLIVSAPNSTIRGLAINRFTSSGVTVSGQGATGNTIEGNFVGTNASGTTDLGNGGNGGVLVTGAANATVGGGSPGARNVISGNAFGINLSGADSAVVENNVIGLNATGDAVVKNDRVGVTMQNGSDGALVKDNVISGNGNRVEGGVTFTSGSTGGRVEGNLIGTDASGTQDLGNTGAGVAVNSSGTTDNTVGGTQPGVGNVISGNDRNGVWLLQGASGNAVEGNLIGTDISGTRALGNTGPGVVVQSSGTTGNAIGGTQPGARNVISGNGEHGVAIFDAARNNGVLGNRIGTNAAGTAALPNNSWGVILDNGATANRIGGPSDAAGNLISGNTVGGVMLEDDAPDNTLQGNLIGTNASGDGALGNKGFGVNVDGPNNLIGGAVLGAANTIAHNGRNGVTIDEAAATGNTISRNSIFSNTGLGIDLGASGVTPNDPSDADAGANNLQNYPLITSVARASGSVTVEGTLNSTPNGDFRIELYSSPDRDPSGYGEGAQYLGEATVQADGDGNATFRIAAENVPAGRYFAVTATNTATDDTSEFSATVNTSPTLGLDGPSVVDEGSAQTYGFTVTDPDPNDAFAVIAGFPDCGTGGELVGGSLNTTATGGSFECRFPQGPASPTVRLRIKDSGGTLSNLAEKAVEVRNAAPKAENQTVETREETEKTVTLAATDPGGDGVSFLVTALPEHGKLFEGRTTGGAPITAADLPLALGGNEVTYLPDRDYNGPDSFSYSATDGVDRGEPATVSVSVSAVNDAPVARGDSYATDEDEPLNAAAPGVLGNDSDVDGDRLSAALVNGPEHGTLSLDPDGSFVYRPDADYNGPDSFDYEVRDGSGGTANATVTITVRPVNDRPVAANDAYSTDANKTLTAPPPGVLANDSDADGDRLAARLLARPRHGALSLRPDGSFSYRPNGGYSGPDSFSYGATDGRGGEAAATARITVRDTVAPTVTRMRLHANPKESPGRARLKAYFSEAMRAGTVNARTVLLVPKGKGGKPVAASVRYSAKERAAVLVPRRPLAPGAYKARVTGGAKDLAGNGVSGDAGWTVTITRTGGQLSRP
jgi:VCBS repeat-containing protein